MGAQKSCLTGFNVNETGMVGMDGVEMLHDTGNET